MTTEGRSVAPPSNASKSNNPGQAAALRGAALAFGKPPVKPKPNIDVISSTNNNSALAAATKANKSPSRADDEGIRPQPSGGSSGSSGTDYSNVARRTSGQFSTDSTGHLKIPGELVDRLTSPSFIAATLAASRSLPVSPQQTGHGASSPSPRHITSQQPTSPSPRHRAPPLSRSPSARRNVNHQQRGVPADALDTSSIPPTTSLIGMFEKSSIKPMDERPRTPLTAAKSHPPEIKSPKPIRARPVSISESITPELPPVLGPKPARRHSGTLLSTPVKKPSPPVVIAAQRDDDDASSDDSFVSASETRRLSQTTKPVPIPPPARKPQRPHSLHGPNSRSPSVNYTTMTVDSLADAIVASALASSRTASPTKSILSGPPLPPPRNPKNHKNPLFHHHQHDNRTPSPAKGFRTTMRKPKDEREEEDRNLLRAGKRNLVKKHPNKHHEGDRKRWRDEVTERERRRYEAVWASNRGMFITSSNDGYGKTTYFPPPPTTSGPVPPPRTGTGLSLPGGEEKSESVSNIVVRDIWSRSRLGPEVLGEVWDLVDRSGKGSLSKEEFVTGLWLIDQRLKGRKLPIKVSESVWNSVGALLGIKVKNNKR